MDKNFELISMGMGDSVDILSLDEMDGIIGGDVKCRKKYAKNGVECHGRYVQTSTIISCAKKYSSNGSDLQR